LTALKTLTAFVERKDDHCNPRRQLFSELGTKAVGRMLNDIAVEQEIVIYTMKISSSRKHAQLMMKAHTRPKFIIFGVHFGPNIFLKDSIAFSTESINLTTEQSREIEPSRYKINSVSEITILFDKAINIQKASLRLMNKYQKFKWLDDLGESMNTFKEIIQSRDSSQDSTTSFD